MKRVVLLKSGLDRLGGAEKYTWQLAKAFRDQGAEVTLLTSGEIKTSPFKTYSCSLNTPLSFLKVKRFDKFCMQTLKTLSPDAVFGLDRNRFQTHLRASNGVHAAYLQKRHEQAPLWKSLSLDINPLHRVLLQIEKQAFEHPDLQVLFTNSSMVREEILNYYTVDPTKIQVVHNGVEWHEMEADFLEAQARKQERSSSAFELLFIGHNYQRKGLSNLLEGLALLPHRDFHLSVIGKEKNPAKFQELAKKLGLEKQVTFLGSKKEIRPFYQMADALAIPSFYDPFANVTVEALAMGLHVISSRFNGGAEVLTPESGTIIEELTSPESMALALQRAMDLSRNALQIRNSISHLDFSRQMQPFIDRVLG
jgi:UDP-glucose:(heptosyl)LPS alpha-1,3-glucosyltransferase